LYIQKNLIFYISFSFFFGLFFSDRGVCTQFYRLLAKFLGFDNCYFKKASTEEEKAENKQYIPNKSLEGEFESQVKSHIHSSHRKNHEVKRLKPGHGTARDMLEITYPSPMLPTVPHQAPTRQNQKETRPHTLNLRIGPNKKPIGSLVLNQDKTLNNPPSSLNGKAKEEAMLKVVDKLQSLLPK